MSSTSRTKKISFIALGSFIVTVGVYHLVKRKHNNKVNVDELIDNYNDNHNNSRVEFDDIQTIDVSKRTYHELSKKL